MPEMVEVELYRRSVLDTVGHRITEVEVLDPRWCPEGPLVADLLRGRHIVDVARHGKVLLVATDGPTLGLRFGMTGRLVVSGRSAVTELVYGAHGDDPRWTRLVMITDGPAGPVHWEVSDPRRLGRLEVDPDLSGLGPDAFDVDADVLRDRLTGRRAPLKTLLLDQSVVAGLGNMIVDDVLLRSGLAPVRGADTLGIGDLERLAAAIALTLPLMLDAGGSNCGLLSADLRRADAPCPVDGRPLRRSVVGGRATYWCAGHQV